MMTDDDDDDAAAADDADSDYGDVDYDDDDDEDGGDVDEGQDEKDDQDDDDDCHCRQLAGRDSSSTPFSVAGWLTLGRVDIVETGDQPVTVTADKLILGSS